MKVKLNSEFMSKVLLGRHVATIRIPGRLSPEVVTGIMTSSYVKHAVRYQAKTGYTHVILYGRAKKNVREAA